MRNSLDEDQRKYIQEVMQINTAPKTATVVNKKTSIPVAASMANTKVTNKKVKKKNNYFERVIYCLFNLFNFVIKTIFALVFFGLVIGILKGLLPPLKALAFTGSWFFIFCFYLAWEGEKRLSFQHLEKAKKRK